MTEPTTPPPTSSEQPAPAQPPAPAQQPAPAQPPPPGPPAPPDPATWGSQHGPAPEKPQPYRSGATRAKVAMLLLGAMAVLDSIGLVQDLLGLQLVDRIADGTITVEEADAYDQQVALHSLAWFAVYIPTVIAFLAWLSRAVANVPALGAGEPPSSPRASIGWWFVPIANLWKPYGIVKGVHERLKAVAGGAGPMFPVLAWWLFWIAGSVVDNLAARLFLAGDDLATLRNGMTISAVGNALTIVAAILAILVVRAIQAREDQVAGRLGPVAPAVVPASPA
jgi:Domain of unknown function (DUF4328)